MPTRVSAAEAPEDLWRCHECGWTYPNHHPSAKHRRNHKKQCGKLPGFTAVFMVEAMPTSHGASGSSDDGSSADEDLVANHHPSQEKVLEKITGLLSITNFSDHVVKVGPKKEEPACLTRSLDRSMLEKVATKPNEGNPQEGQTTLKIVEGAAKEETPATAAATVPFGEGLEGRQGLCHSQERNAEATTDGRVQGRGFRSAHAVEGQWICRHCGWSYPNAHPSARHRRKHKRKCGAAAHTAPGGSSDDASSDEEHHRQKEGLENAQEASSSPEVSSSTPRSSLASSHFSLEEASLREETGKRDRVADSVESQGASRDEEIDSCGSKAEAVCSPPQEVKPFTLASQEVGKTDATPAKEGRFSEAKRSPLSNLEGNSLASINPRSVDVASKDCMADGIRSPLSDLRRAGTRSSQVDLQGNVFGVSDKQILSFEAETTSHQNVLICAITNVDAVSDSDSAGLLSVLNCHPEAFTNPKEHSGLMSERPDSGSISGIEVIESRVEADGEAQEVAEKQILQAVHSLDPAMQLGVDILSDEVAEMQPQKPKSCESHIVVSYDSATELPKEVESNVSPMADGVDGTGLCVPEGNLSRVESAEEVPVKNLDILGEELSAVVVQTPAAAEPQVWSVEGSPDLDEVSDSSQSRTVAAFVSKREFLSNEASGLESEEKSTSGHQVDCFKITSEEREFGDLQSGVFPTPEPQVENQESKRALSAHVEDPEYMSTCIGTVFGEADSAAELQDRSFEASDMHGLITAVLSDLSCVDHRTPDAHVEIDSSLAHEKTLTLSSLVGPNIQSHSRTDDEAVRSRQASGLSVERLVVPEQGGLSEEHSEDSLLLNSEISTSELQGTEPAIIVLEKLAGQQNLKELSPSQPREELLSEERTTTLVWNEDSEFGHHAKSKAQDNHGKAHKISGWLSPHSSKSEKNLKKHKKKCSKVANANDRSSSSSSSSASSSSDDNSSNDETPVKKDKQKRKKKHTAGKKNKRSRGHVTDLQLVSNLENAFKPDSVDAVGKNTSGLTAVATQVAAVEVVIKDQADRPDTIEAQEAGVTERRIDEVTEIQEPRKPHTSESQVVAVGENRVDEVSEIQQLPKTCKIAGDPSQMTPAGEGSTDQRVESEGVEMQVSDAPVQWQLRSMKSLISEVCTGKLPLRLDSSDPQDLLSISSCVSEVTERKDLEKMDSSLSHLRVVGEDRTYDEQEEQDSETLRLVSDSPALLVSVESSAKVAKSPEPDSICSSIPQVEVVGKKAGAKEEQVLDSPKCLEPVASGEWQLRSMKSLIQDSDVSQMVFLSEGSVVEVSSKVLSRVNSSNSQAPLVGKVVDDFTPIQDSSMPQVMEGRAFEIAVKSVPSSPTQTSHKNPEKLDSSVSQEVVLEEEKAELKEVATCRSSDPSASLTDKERGSPKEPEVSQKLDRSGPPATPVSNEKLVKGSINEHETEAGEARSEASGLPHKSMSFAEWIPRPFPRQQQPESPAQTKPQEEPPRTPGSPEGLVRTRVEEFEKLAGVDPLQRRKSMSPRTSLGSASTPTTPRTTTQWQHPIPETQKTGNDMPLQSPKELRETLSHLRHQSSNEKKGASEGALLHLPAEVYDVITHLRHRGTIAESNGTQVQAVHIDREALHTVVERISAPAAECCPGVPWLATRT